MHLRLILVYAICHSTYQRGNRMRRSGDRLCLLFVVFLGGVAGAFGQVQTEQNEQPAGAGQAAEERGERRAVRRLGDVLSESNGEELIPAIPEKPGAAVPEPEPERAPSTQALIDDLITQANLALRHGHITEPQGDNAREYFEQVLRIDPENAAAIEGIEEVERRLCFTGKGDKIRPC